MDDLCEKRILEFDVSFDVDVDVVGFIGRPSPPFCCVELFLEETECGGIVQYTTVLIVWAEVIVEFAGVASQLGLMCWLLFGCLLLSSFGGHLHSSVR